MFDSGRYYLGNFGPVPVYVEFNAVFLLLLGWFWFGHLPPAFLITALIILVLSILLHEMGHALAARARHMTGVSVTIGGLGGFCSYAGEPPPGGRISISAAGPLVNYLLAFGGWILWEHGELSGLPAFAAVITFYLNLGLAIFNSLPIYPLDGGQITLALSELVTRNRATARRATLVITIAAAFAAIAAYSAWRGGPPSLLTFGILALCLFQAYVHLR